MRLRISPCHQLVVLSALVVIVSLLVAYAQQQRARYQSSEPEALLATSLKQPEVRNESPQYRRSYPHYELVDDSPASSVFHWTPLSDERSIRLVGLEPGLPDTPISIRLIEVPVGASAWLEYEAISYAWGDPKRSYGIACDGALLYITGNLLAALHHLRYTDRIRILWVDAVSISQTNLTERAAQITRLNEIFTNAGRVVAWLGLEYDNSKLAMEATFDDLPLEVVLKDLKQYTTDQQLTALFSLMTRPWFTRGWMLQEVALAREIVLQCGSDTVPWERLTVAAAVLMSLLYKGKSDLEKYYQLSGMSNFMYLRRLYGEDGEISIKTAHATMVTFNVTDPRDRIYSILGLLDKYYVDNITPSYLLEPWELYRDVSRVMIAGVDGITMLSLATPSHHLTVPDETPLSLRHVWPNASTRMQNLPSWAIDWSYDRYVEGEDVRVLHANTLAYGSREFKPSGEKPAEIHISDANVLLLGGIRIGKVEELCRAYQSDTLRFREDAFPDQSFEWSLMLGWLLIVSHLHTRYRDQELYGPTQEPLAEALWRTMISNTWHRVNGSMELAPPQMGTWADAWFEMISRNNASERFRWKAVEHDIWKWRRDQDGHEVTVEELLEDYGARTFWLHLSRAGMGRSLCFIEHGIMGLCPRVTVEGDLVALLYGGNVHYVLRPICEPFSGQCGDFCGYELVGEAYVHGFMDGQALHNENMPPEVFGIL